MVTTKEKVTPQKAKEWLALEVDNNRKTNHSRVESYARQMLSGCWMENTGETIKFNKSGKLIDGKHRLMAVVKSGKSITFHVNHEIDNDVINVLDSGFVRNTGNILTINSVPNANSIGMLIKVYKTLIDLNGFFPKGSRPYNSIEVLNEYAQDEPFFQNCVRVANRYYHSFNKIIPPSFIGGFYAYCSKYSTQKEQLDMFMEEFFNTNTVCCKTIQTARKKLLDDRLSYTKKLSPGQRYNIIIKAFNNYVKGSKDMTKIFLDTFECVV